MNSDNEQFLIQPESATPRPTDTSASQVSLRELVPVLVQRWVDRGGQATTGQLNASGNRQWSIKVPASSLADFCRHLLRSLPLYLVTMVGLDERERSGSYRLHYVFGVDKSKEFLVVETEIRDGIPDSLLYQSITPLVPAANWYEREARDLFGLIPQGHPDPRRVVLHRHWPDGVRPLRKDFDGAYQPPFVHDDDEFRNRTGGEGIVEIPVGPIHAGIIEPGHFRFSAVGEQIVNLEARFFFTHRGVEKQVEGLDVERAVFVVERNCAACTVSSTLAYCQALEGLGEVVIPENAAYLRLVFAELERLYNHVGDLGNICAGIGFHAGSQRGLFLKEELLALNENLFGSRYLFGLIRPGGVRRGLNHPGRWALREKLWWLREQNTRLVKLILGNDGVVDRFTNTGVLKYSSAFHLGAVGVAARASGVDRDERRDHPYGAYQYLLPTSIPVLQSGDVYARFLIRVEEVNTSIELLLQALEFLDNHFQEEAPLAVPLGELPAFQSAFSLTESARGSNCHWLMTGPNNTLYRYRVRTASYANWSVVPRAVLNNIVPDFPLINKSFELCYSCLDR